MFTPDTHDSARSQLDEFPVKLLFIIILDILINLFVIAGFGRRSSRISYTTEAEDNNKNRDKKPTTCPSRNAQKEKSLKFLFTRKEG